MTTVSALSVSKVKKGKVGRKGELFLPKKVREIAGREPGDEVTYLAEKRKVEIRKIPIFKKHTDKRNLQRSVQRISKR
jgi:bifunctional DNA-binding transcriptional regulator/antitoxin component of YhaV-PrlF toxin-antitoxin module